jgi:hypothetical protein
MSDLEALRSALTAPPGQFGKVDVDRIMELGARKRAHRRMGVVGGAMTVVVALTGTVFGVAQLREGPPPSLAVATPETVVSIPAPPPEFVVPTGARDSDGEMVLVLRQGLPVDGTVSYGLSLGHRDAVGRVTEETATGPRAASQGFHALTAGRPGRDIPLYGYYAGPATRITAQVHGLTVTAQTMVLPDLDVTVFWFPLRHADLLDGAPWVPLYAYDANENRLGS